MARLKMEKKNEEQRDNRSKRMRWSDSITAVA
jgi:hypothetical protein